MLLIWSFPLLKKSGLQLQESKTLGRTSTSQGHHRLIIGYFGIKNFNHPNLRLKISNNLELDIQDWWNKSIRVLAMLLGPIKNMDRCVTDSPKIVYSWRVRHGCGSIFGESEQLIQNNHCGGCLSKLRYKVWYS